MRWGMTEGKHKSTKPNETIKSVNCYQILHLLFSDSGGTRTPNHQSRNLIFYPVELRSL